MMVVLLRKEYKTLDLNVIYDSTHTGEYCVCRFSQIPTQRCTYSHTHVQVCFSHTQDGAARRSGQITYSREIPAQSLGGRAGAGATRLRALRSPQLKAIVRRAPETERERLGEPRRAPSSPSETPTFATTSPTYFFIIFDRCKISSDPAKSCQDKRPIIRNYKSA